MKKFLRLLALTVIVLLANSAAAFAEDRYEQVRDIAVQHILTVFNGEPFIHRELVTDMQKYQNWSYSVYYNAPLKGNALFSIPGCLIFLSHGYHDSSGYQMVINGRGYSDYISAADSLLAQLRNAGYFSGLEYSYVLVNTCYPSYMQSNVFLPQMNMNMTRAINHPGITAFAFDTDSGYLKLSLYKVFSVNSDGVESTSASRSRSGLINYKGRTLIIQ